MICRLCSKRRSCGSLGKKIQVTRIGWVALHAERLSLSGRRSLPRHPILQSRLVSIAVWRRDLKGHLHKPVADGRKREFFGMNNFRNAREPLIAGRCLRGQGCTFQRCARQQCRNSNGELHDVFRLGCIPMTRLLVSHNNIKVHVCAIGDGTRVARSALIGGSVPIAICQAIEIETAIAPAKICIRYWLEQGEPGHDAEQERRIGAADMIISLLRCNSSLEP